MVAHLKSWTTQCEPSVNKGNVNILSSFTFNPFNSLNPAPSLQFGFATPLSQKANRGKKTNQADYSIMVRETETHPAVLVFHFGGRTRSCGSCGRRLSSRRQEPRADPGIMGRGDVLSATGSLMVPSVWVCFYYVTF